MAAQAPTVGEIRTAKRQAVGGARKRCRKGKNCSAACIQAGMECLVQMPEPAGVATTKVRNMLQQRMGGKMAAPAQPTTAMMRPSAADQQLKSQAKGILREGKSPSPQTPPRSKPVEVKPKAPGAPQQALAKPVEKRKTEAPQPAAEAGPAWLSKYSGRSEALNAQLNELRAKIGSLPPEQQAYWNEQINKQMNPKLASRNGTPYSPEKTNKSLTSQAKAWNFLISNGPPGELTNRIGEKRVAPKGMIPDVTSSGQRKWISPDDGLKYSLNKGNWRQNRVSKADTDRRLPDITNFRKDQKEQGAAWPAQKMSPREGLPKTAAEVIKSLSPSEKNAIVFNGLDATGNEGLKLRAYYNANPKEKEARLNEIVQRWHDQGGRSGVSGKPVALPGLEPKKGEERSSVDHFQPISTNRAKALPAADMRKIADNYKNFLIAEEGPNSQRGARTWDNWLDKRESSGGSKAAATSTKAAAPVKKTPPAPPVKKEPPAPPVKKAPTPASPEGDPHATKLTGVAAIQKFADDRKLKDLETQAAEYKKRWEDTIGNGAPETSKKAWDVYSMLKKKHDEFKQEYDDKYFQATPRLSLQELSKRISQAKDEYEDARGTPNQAAAKAKFDKAIADYEKAKGAPAPAASARGLKPEQDERIDNAAAATNRRIEKQINERQFYDDATNARIRAQNEARMAPFQKMNDDEKAALSLYGQDGVKFYQQVNQLLRSGQMEDSSPDKVKMAEFISGNLRSGLEKLPPAKVEELQRAVSGNFAQSFGSLKVGDVVEDKGFGSYTNKGNTTLDQFLKRDQPNAVIRILNPRSAREVAPVMEYNTEGEHISLPGTRYRLVSAEEKGVYSRKTGGYVPQYTFEEVSE